MDKSISEIIEGIKITVSEGMGFFQRETEKLLKSISNDLQELINISNKYKSLAEKNKTEWKTIKKEVEMLEGRRGALKTREEKVDKMVGEAEKEAENLAALHKVLDNRRRLLDGREAEIKTKERRQVI